MPLFFIFFATCFGQGIDFSSGGELFFNFFTPPDQQIDRWWPQAAKQDGERDTASKTVSMQYVEEA